MRLGYDSACDSLKFHDGLRRLTQNEYFLVAHATLVFIFNLE